MNRGMIYISSCVAVGVLLFPSFVDRAHADCDPPRDISSCRVVSRVQFAQPSPALPETPFLVTDPQMTDTLMVTHFDQEPKSSAPAGNSCTSSNVRGCASVSSVELVDSGAVAKQSGSFLVRFQDGRSLLASPVR